MSKLLSFEAYIIHISFFTPTIGVQKPTCFNHVIYVKILKFKVNNMELKK
jgi:hypothetical protein